MKMGMLLVLLVAASVAGSCQGQIHHKPIPTNTINCLSWRLAEETNNIIGWGENPPTECLDYIKQYLLGNQYRDDSKAVIDEAICYLSNLSLPKDRKNIWVFDIDETLISNVASFLNRTSGSKSLTFALFDDPAPTPTAPALPESQRLYNKVLSLGVKAVILTGRRESKRAATIANLKDAGYNNWFKLILKSDYFVKKNSTAVEYKSTIRAHLELKGYRIVGNIGDQWSDITGPSPGRRVFKLPNPMYYIP